MRIAFAVLKYFPFGGLERDMLRMAGKCRKEGAPCRDSYLEMGG